MNDHQEPLLLLLHRFQKAEILPKPIISPGGFDLNTYIERELTFPIGGKIRLAAIFYNKADIQRISEAQISKDQKITCLDDGSFELIATIEDTRQLHWWLKGFGSRVKVIGPDSLRNKFSELARELINLYS